MHFKEKLAIGLSIILAVVGLGVEFYWDCTEAFSRSGSFIVCVGIYFGFQDLGPVIQRDYLARKNHLESTRQEHDIVFSDDELKDEVRGTTDAVLKQAEHSKEKDIRRVMKVDALILAVGTLIWGLGDLLPGYPC